MAIITNRSATELVLTNTATRCSATIRYDGYLSSAHAARGSAIVEQRFIRIGYRVILPNGLTYYRKLLADAKKIAVDGIS